MFELLEFFHNDYNYGNMNSCRNPIQFVHPVFSGHNPSILKATTNGRRNWMKKLDWELDRKMDGNCFFILLYGRKCWTEQLDGENWTEMLGPNKWTDMTGRKCWAPDNWTDKLDGHVGPQKKWTVNIGRKCWAHLLILLLTSYYRPSTTYQDGFGWILMDLDGF